MGDPKSTNSQDTLPKPPHADPADKAVGDLRIGIIVGHEKKAQGAMMPAPCRMSEYAYNSEIASIAKEYARKIGVTLDVIFRDGIGISGAYKKAKSLGVDCVIELHFNSYNGKVSGTETLCSSEAVDRSFAEAIQKAMCKVFDRGGMSRGLKIMDSGRGAQSCTSYPGKANCLVEPFFGDNPAEAKMAIERKVQYAHALIDACIEWANSRIRVKLA